MTAAKSAGGPLARTGTAGGPLAGKAAIVTGAGRGIGRAVALALAGQGASVVVAARTQTEIDDVRKEIESRGRRAVAVRADVGEEAEATRIVAAAMAEFGRIDILVNNAGIGSFAPVEELAVRDFDAMWRVNMRGVFLMTRKSIPELARSGGGDIVNLASLAGRNAFTGGAGYAATKWALIGFSRCLMLEVRERNIRVITVCPGSVDTDFSGPSERRPGVIPTAEEIARVCVDAVTMPRHVMVSEIDVRPTNPKG